MCTGRIDLEMLLSAFYNGADGVFIVGCRLGECNYTTHGNYDARNLTFLTKKILSNVGINPERLRIEFMTSGDGILFAEMMNEFGSQVKHQGPIGTSEEPAPDEIKSSLEKLLKLVPYIKIKTNSKTGIHQESQDAYEDPFTQEEVDILLGEIASYYIDPENCQSCSICAGRCPVECIAGDKQSPYVIDQDTCIRCGTCLDVCPPRFRAVSTRISSLFT